MIGQSLHIRRPIQQGAPGLIIRQADAGPIRRDHPHPQTACDARIGMTLPARPRQTVTKKQRLTRRIAVFGVS
jgi:hypothetical protein